MKNLNTYVEELMYRHQCVIVPDFGAFVSNRKAAELGQNNTFFPPQKELTFNSRLTYNDGLVAKHISESEKISYEQAQEHIKTQVQQWKEMLQKKEVLAFNNLGSFSLGIDNNIIFEPSNKENFLTESFGMGTITTHEVEKSEDANTSKEGFQENPSVSVQEAQDGAPKRKIPVLIRYAAVGIIALSAISYGIYLFGSQPTTNNTIAQAPDPKVVQEKVNEQISQASFMVDNPLELPEITLDVKKDPKLVQKRIEEEKRKQKELEKANKNLADTEQKNQTNTSATPTKIVGNYHLIAGAFSSEQNALTRVEQLKQEGFDGASVVGKNAKGLFMVAFKSFETHAQAKSYISKVKNKGFDTWVYISK